MSCLGCPLRDEIIMLIMSITIQNNIIINSINKVGNNFEFLVNKYFIKNAGSKMSAY